MSVIAEPAPKPFLDDAVTPGPWRGRLWLCGNFIAVVLIVYFSIFYGLRIRRWAWEQSTEIHFRNSLNNAIAWGQYTNINGKLKVYQMLVDQYGEDGSYKAVHSGVAMHYPKLPLDYPPLRLLIMARWEAWTEKNFPVKHPWNVKWQNTYEFNRPMLTLNTTCELVGAIAMFLLVHYWLRQCADAPIKQWIQPLRGLWPALLAALLLWFNPAVIFNAHSYPQWDVWILPAFLLAIYLGLLDQWLLAGICIGIVSLGKGQILLVTPTLIVWQLFIWRPGAIVRLLIGIVLATGAIASPWMVPGQPADRWIICVIIALGAMIMLFFRRDWSRDSLIIHGVSLIVCMGLVFWPWVRHAHPPDFGWTFLAFLAVAAAARFLPLRWAPALIAGSIAASLFACVPLFGGSMAWYTVGIEFPTHNWQLLYWCKAMNLGAILQENFHWEWHDKLNLADYLPFIHHEWIMPMRYLMITAYGTSLVLCGIGMAIHHRRKSPMFFFAMVTPWVLLFALLPQMQNRYLVWAAAFSAATAAFSLDGFMLYLLLAFISVVDTALDMMLWEPNSTTSKLWLPRIAPMFPDMAWAVLLIAGIWLYLALSPGRRRPLLPIRPQSPYPGKITC